MKNFFKLKLSYLIASFFFLGVKMEVFQFYFIFNETTNLVFFLKFILCIENLFFMNWNYFYLKKIRYHLFKM